jgi:type IV pilus assembly protein PilN
MIQINLLPVRLQKRREGARQIASIYLLSIALVGAILGLLWIHYDGEIKTRKVELSAVQQEVAKYARFDTALQQIQKSKELVDKKREVIKDLQGDRDAVVRILALLSIQVPSEKMWFEKLSQSGLSITLDGVAQSNEAIVEFMRNLETSPYIEKGSINLVLSRQLAVKQMKLREFQLTYRFHPYSEVQKRLKM